MITNGITHLSSPFLFLLYCVRQAVYPASNYLFLYCLEIVWSACCSDSVFIQQSPQQWYSDWDELTEKKKKRKKKAKKTTIVVWSMTYNYPVSLMSWIGMHCMKVKGIYLDWLCSRSHNSFLADCRREHRFPVLFYPLNCFWPFL